MEQQEAERRLQDLRDALLDDWLLVTEHLAGTQQQMESSLSWRVTAPLRLVRLFQVKARELGLPAATRLGTAVVARRLGRGA